MHELKNASFITAMMSMAQKSSIDMLMYYNLMKGEWCGAFDMYSFKLLKGYYPLMWYGKFYDMENEIRAENKIENIYSLCGVDKNGKVLCAITYYSDDDNLQAKDYVCCKAKSYTEFQNKYKTC